MNFTLKKFALFASLGFCFASAKPAAAQTIVNEPCPRPAISSPVGEPADLRSQNGALRVDFTVHNSKQVDESVRYCYVDAAGNQSPTLRVKLGDLVIIHLKNELTDIKPASAALGTASGPPNQAAASAALQTRMAGHGTSATRCTSAMMNAVSTNLHFHGLTIPAICHQDDVLNTSIQPGDSPFEYRFRIPADEPPGLYWYHPHIHGFAKVPVLGGASGAIIVEGIERANKAVAGLPERVLIIRDQDLLNPGALPSKSEPVVPKMLIDRDGDAANNGTGFGKPAKDLSINFVPVPYPDYPPAQIQMRPQERQFWRVLNASAITYLNLAVLFDRKPQPLDLVSIDGVPVNEKLNGGESVDTQTHLGVPPGARVEFIVQGPPAGITGLLVTRTVDTGPAGENDPNRALATITASNGAPEPRSRLLSSPESLLPSQTEWLGNVTPVRTRTLYFSEKQLDPNDPTSAVEFYLTVDGQTPAQFDLSSGLPNIVAKQGTVEAWIIENRSSELHAFHIHQLHFLLLDYLETPMLEPFLRDIVNVPYYNGRTLVYPSVRLRMDFRDPNTVGTYLFHCHLLEHEDGGMMGLIRVDPANAASLPNNTSTSGK